MTSRAGALMMPGMVYRTSSAGSASGVGGKASPPPGGGSTPPVALRPGDRVAVVAPSGPVDPARLRSGLDRLAARYRVQLRGDVFARHGYLAGSDATRAEALQEAFADPEVRGIFMARGGYGLTRILDRLDPGALRADPKPLVGFSDGTALLSWAQTAGVVAFHGPVVSQLGALDTRDLAHLFRLVEEPTAEMELRGAPGAPWGATGPGASRRSGRRERERVTGVLRGGNLTVLAALAGTPWQVPLRDAILLVEDVGEAPYRLDRAVTQLLQQPTPWSAAEARAVGLGAFVGCRGDAGAPAALQVLVERLGGGRPWLVGMPFGHGARNRAWPVGLRVTLDFRQGVVRWRGAVLRG